MTLEIAVSCLSSDPDEIKKASAQGLVRASLPGGSSDELMSPFQPMHKTEMARKRACLRGSVRPRKGVVLVKGQADGTPAFHNDPGCRQQIVKFPFHLITASRGQLNVFKIESSTHLGR